MPIVRGKGIIGKGGSSPLDAGSVTVDTTNFDRNLGPGDTDVQKALETIDDLVSAGAPLASDVPVDTTNFDRNLGPDDTDVQTALETLDDLRVVTLPPVHTLNVIDDSLSSPPGTIARGDSYIVGSSPAGDWSGFNEGDLITYNGGWKLILAGLGGSPAEGLRVIVTGRGNGTGAGSFAGHGGDIGEWSSTLGWSWRTPETGDVVPIAGVNEVAFWAVSVYSGSSWRAQTLTSAKNIIHVSGSGNGSFTSIKAALDSITDSGSSNNYLVVVDPGYYPEDPMVIPEHTTLTTKGSEAIAIVSASVAGSPLFTMSPYAIASFLTIQGPSASDSFYIGAGVDHVSITNCSFSSGYRAIRVSGTGAGVHSFFERNRLFRYNCVRVEDGGTLVVEGVDMFNEPGDSGIGIDLDNAEAFVRNCTFGDIGTAVRADNNSSVLVSSVTINNADVGINTGTTGDNYITGASILSSGESTNDILQEAAGGYITLSGSQLRETTFSIFDWSTVNLGFVSPTDQITYINGALSVGIPEAGKRTYLGEGAPYVRGMNVITTDSTATSTTEGGNLTDISEIAAELGSYFTFQGADANHTIIIGSELDDTFDVLKHWGLLVFQETGAVEATPKSFVFEYWDGSAWTAFNVMALHARYRYRYANEIFIRSSSEEYIIYGVNSNTPWVKKSILSKNLYWVRIRIATTLTSLPSFEEFRLFGSTTVFNEDGTKAMIGKSRVGKTLFSVGNVWGEGGGVSSGSIDVGSPGWSHEVKNSLLKSDSDYITIQYTLPRGIDTSSPLDFRVVYAVPVAGTVATVTLSVKPNEVQGVAEADPTGGIEPVIRTLANTESRTAAPAQGVTLVDIPLADTTKDQLIEFKGYDISDYYEGDLVYIRFFVDDVGSGDMLILMIEVKAVTWTDGDRT